MIKVCRVEDLPELTAKVIMVEGAPVAVFHAGGRFFAWDNRCPHRGASLADGYLGNQTIQCKFHLWEFDIEKACAVANEKITIKTYPLVIENGIIFINR